MSEFEEYLKEFRQRHPMCHPTSEETWYHQQARIAELDSKLKKSMMNTAFFRCCALSGEVPTEGEEPYPSLEAFPDDN